jgi:hypothetical protein
MPIQNIINNSSTFTTRLLKNKTLLKNLERISEHGTSYTAGISLLMSAGLRPLSIYMTPDVEKENKQYAIANSISSGLVKFGIVEAIALPIERAVKNIDKNPEKFLNSQTLKDFISNTNPIESSKAYKLMTQIIKLGTGIITAIPKSMITIALIPILMDKLFQKRKKEQEFTKNSQNRNKHSLNFTGNLSNKISKNLGKIIDNKKFQNFAIKNKNQSEDIAKHITAGTDVLLTTTSVIQTNNSKRIKEDRKKALIYNNVISTGVTLFGGYQIDKIIKKRTEKFIEKFKKINANDTKLNKYIEGINILRPALIFAGIYYGILPIFSTYTSEKIDKLIQKQKLNSNR